MPGHRLDIRSYHRRLRWCRHSYHFSKAPRGSGCSEDRWHLTARLKNKNRCIGWCRLIVSDRRHLVRKHRCHRIQKGLLVERRHHCLGRCRWYFHKHLQLCKLFRCRLNCSVPKHYRSRCIGWCPCWSYRSDWQRRCRMRHSRQGWRVCWHYRNHSQRTQNQSDHKRSAMRYTAEVGRYLPNNAPSLCRDLMVH